MKLGLFLKPPRYFARFRAVEKILSNYFYKSVFELGYGDGFLISTISIPGSQYRTGFEISDSAKSAAKGIFLKYGVSDLASIPKDLSLDLFMSFETIGYFKRPSEFFAKAHKALRTGGSLLFSATLLDGENFEEQTTGMKVFSQEFLLAEIQKSGFKVVSCLEYGGALVLYVHRLRRIMRKVFKIESQKVSESWRDPFRFKLIKVLYLMINFMNILFERTPMFLSEESSGLLILARKEHN